MKSKSQLVLVATTGALGLAAILGMRPGSDDAPHAALLALEPRPEVASAEPLSSAAESIEPNGPIEAEGEDPDEPALANTFYVPESTTLQEHVAAADMIIRATCVEIRSRMSDVPGPDSAALPLTFVTFRVDAVTWGQISPGELFTVRQIGGPFPNGNLLMTDDDPAFLVGDQEVLLLHRTPEGLGSLVHGPFRRFRITADGSVFGETGHQLFVNGDELVFGPRTAEAVAYLARPNAWGIGLQYNVSESEEAAPEASPGTPVNATGLMELLLRWRVAACAEDPTPPPPIRSADFGEIHDLGSLN